MDRSAVKFDELDSSALENSPAINFAAVETAPGAVEPAYLTAFREYILTGAKPRSARKIGAEWELLGYTRASRQRLDFRQVQAVLDGLVSATEEHTFDAGVYAGAHYPGGGDLTVEPGGQLEFSTAPYFGLAELERDLNAFQDKLRAISAEQRIQFLAIGFDPLRTIAEQQWYPKPRYDVMRPYMAGRGERAWDMMTRTAAIQVSLDFENERDLIRKYTLGNRLAPIVTAIFANSPFADGRESGSKSTRALTWLETDPDRCGGPGSTLSGSFGLDDFIDQVLDVPMLFRRRDGTYRDDATGMKFGDYLRAHHLSGAEAVGDFADQLTGIFTEARIKQFIELRSTDCGSIQMTLAAQALWKGILYDDDSSAQAFHLMPDLSAGQFHELQYAVARDGLQAIAPDVSILPLAKQLVELATAGLRRIDPNELTYLEILQQQVLIEEISPADILLRNWRGGWHGSMPALFDHITVT